MKKTLILAFFLLFLNSSFAKTWETVDRGYWSSPSVWAGGEAPNYFSTRDTFLIMHPVVIDSSLIFDQGALLFIDSAGGICGHQTMKLLNGVRMKMYGVLDLDTLYLSGSHAQCFQPGNVILTNYGIVTGPNGTELDIYCQFEVGPWFDCKLPEYDYLMGVDELVNNELTVYPNPFNSIATLSFSKPLINGIAEVFNSMGQRVMVLSELQGNSIQIERRDLPEGMYTMKLMDKVIVRNINFVIH